MIKDILVLACLALSTLTLKVSTYVQYFEWTVGHDRVVRYLFTKIALLSI